jgi:TrmH family RNA methyltransferase
MVKFMMQRIFDTLPRAETITSRTNGTVVSLGKLSLAKHRAEQGLFLAEGIKLSEEAAGLPEIRYILLRSDDGTAPVPLLDLARRAPASARILVLPTQVFEKISTENAPQGIITVLAPLTRIHRTLTAADCTEDTAEKRILAVDSVQDPGNLGAVIRSAVAFGVDRIVLTDDCVDVYNPKTVRSAMGSLFKVRINVVSDLSEFIKALKAAGRRVFAAELRDGAISLAEAALTTSDTVIIGNEGHGIPVEISSLCTGSVYIPISGKTESLNASVAASIFIWEQSKSK